MSTVATQPAFPIQIPKPTLWSRYLSWRETPRPVTVESILSAAEQGQLDAHLSKHYTIYYDANWIDNLQLCRDLVEGTAQSRIHGSYDGSPMFLKGMRELRLQGGSDCRQASSDAISKSVSGWAIGIATVIGIALIGAYLKRTGSD